MGVICESFSEQSFQNEKEKLEKVLSYSESFEKFLKFFKHIFKLWIETFEKKFKTS